MRGQAGRANGRAQEAGRSRTDVHLSLLLLAPAGRRCGRCLEGKGPCGGGAALRAEPRDRSCVAILGRGEREVGRPGGGAGRCCNPLVGPPSLRSWGMWCFSQWREAACSVPTPRGLPTARVQSGPSLGPCGKVSWQPAELSGGQAHVWGAGQSKFLKGVWALDSSPPN